MNTDSNTMINGQILRIGDIITPVHYDRSSLAIITHFDFLSDYEIRVTYLNGDLVTNGFSRAAKLEVHFKSSKLTRLLFE